MPFLATAFAGGTGGGDFKYAAPLGALTGWYSPVTALTGVLIALLAASLLGLVTATRNRTMRSQVRLGPALYLGATIVITVGNNR